jgi:(p)ppGpp synthase/HD superfamily hydrolase
MTMSSLESAIAIAAQAHTGQVDKAGAPYILHPIRVMLRVETLAERIVAVLHDVVEDTDWSLERLREAGFPEPVLSGLDAVTRREGEDYDDFVRRAAQDPIGRVVKRADLEDNLDLGRIPVPSDKDRARVEKYRRALRILEGEGDSGPDL